MNDRMEVVKLHDRLLHMDQLLQEQTRSGTDFRRDLYGMQTAIKAKFTAMKLVVKGRLAVIEWQLALLTTRQAEAGRRVQPYSCYARQHLHKLSYH